MRVTSKGIRIRGTRTDIGILGKTWDTGSQPPQAFIGFPPRGECPLAEDVIVHDRTSVDRLRRIRWYRVEQVSDFRKHHRTAGVGATQTAPKAKPVWQVSPTESI